MRRLARRCQNRRAMIFATMPDLPPRPATPANAAFRESFLRRWGRENALVCGFTRNAEYQQHGQTLSVKAAWGGRERFLLAEREVAVDDDHWLILNDGRRYASVLRNDRPMASMAIFFRPGLAAEVAAARGLDTAAALDRPDAPAASRHLAPEFSEHLRAHDGGDISRRLRALWHAVQDGERSEDWLEEQSLLLVDRLLGQGPLRVRGATRRSARDELRRRLRLAADHIDTCHAQPLDLEAMARVACLSRWHFVRHFRAEFGITPYAFLLRKRARVAARLLAAGQGDREAVALACGFGSRFALARALARWAAPRGG
jgi:AraC family transcriptional regulator